jgi:hypothetical protein
LERDVVPMGNFLNVTTNENGDRYYIMNYHYFKKIEYISYKDNYENDTVKEYLKLNKFNDSNIKNLENKLEDNLETCTQFINNTFVYIPQAVCLVSRYPFAKQMEKCLEAILKMIVDSNVSNDEIYKFTQHLTCEIPIPPPFGKILFYIPYHPQSIEIYGEKELPQTNYNAKILLEYFSIENIISIHHLMLLEQKFLFVSSHVSRLFEVTESFLHLLFPMNWINTYIPVLSEEMIKYLQSFMPFVMGIEESMLKIATPFLDSDETIYIVNIDKNIIDSNFNKKGKKLNKRKILRNLPELPDSNNEELSNELKRFKKVSNKLTPDKALKTLRDIFMKSMIMLFGDYKKYVAYIDGSPLFNTESLLKNRHNKNKSFYDELTQTTIFRQFLQQDNINSNSYFQNMILRYNSSINTSRRSSSVKRTSTVNDAMENENQNSSLGNIINNINIGVLNRKYSGVDNLNTDSISSRIHNSDEMDQYMVRPFCLNDNIISTELFKMEEIIAEKYKYKNMNVKIISGHKNLNFDQVGRTFNRFILNDHNSGNSKIY